MPENNSPLMYMCAMRAYCYILILSTESSSPEAVVTKFVAHVSESNNIIILIYTNVYSENFC